MRLTIVMPVLDEAAGIGAALDALQPLRARGVEVIVADGGSRDGTVGLALPLVDLVVPAPRGRAVQMNAGAREASGDALLFLHADTQLPPDADALILSALATRDWGRFDVRITGTSFLLPVVARLMNLRSRLSGIATGDQAMFMRRATFAAAGGFPAIALMEDIALSARLKQLGRPATLRARVTTSGRRWEKHGVLRTIALMWQLRFAYFLGAKPDDLARRLRLSSTRRGCMNLRPEIMIFARAPIPGACKTRLIRALGAQGAAALHSQLVEHTLHTALASEAGPVSLWCADDITHPFFEQCAARYPIALRAQTGDDLGARMLNAFHHAQGPALLAGSDAPVIDANDWRDCARALVDHDAVFLPAEDGGYGLVGLREAQPALFGDMTWSHAGVMETTRERLRAAELRWQEVRMIWDIDEPQDLARLRATGFPV